MVRGAKKNGGRKGGEKKKPERKERGREDVMRRKRISKGERREGRMIRRKGGRRQKVKGES